MFIEIKQELELIILKKGCALLLNTNLITYTMWKEFLIWKT
jgi:hypothetical protein